MRLAVRISGFFYVVGLIALVAQAASASPGSALPGGGTMVEYVSGNSGLGYWIAVVNALVQNFSLSL